ncbi:MAG TPA: HAMP domain-containing sensor histidine kinase, partial [Candidatus Saccharimonadia bacterium]|nr:HAMP domain-containing sensor histidine kinase [Candidatus Saccharimonadia bacterium]
SGFNVSQTAAEYRALRASVIRLWLATGPELGPPEIDELIRFNEAMDQALAESVFYFAKSAARDRNLFLGVLSHELRTPLATIAASAHVIQKSEALQPLRDSAARILRGSKRIESVLNDLLEYVRSGAGGGMRVTPSSLLADELCARIAREVEVAVPGASVRTEFIGAMSAVWDAQRIAQAVSNLTTNAIKYGTPGAAVALVVDGSAEDQIAISVRNNGEPIPAAVRESLFEPLVRGTGPDRAGFSLGLGLYIVREIAHAHGGDVAVASPEPGTTAFTMTLPRLTDPSARTAFGVLGRQAV